MFALLLILTIIGIATQSVAMKEYNKRISGGAFTYSALSILSALIVFIIISGGNLNFSLEYVPYSIGFAVLYSAATVGSFFAISAGSLSLTALISKYSLLVPSLCGILFLSEPTSVLLYVGILLLAVSLFLVNREDKKTEKQISLKWALFVLIAFIGNGGCSTVQKVQQINFGGEGKNEFMILALLISFVVMLIFALVFEKESIGKKITTGARWYITGGFANGLVNLFVMMLAVWPASVVFPIISAGGILVTSFLGIFVYKEKISPSQIVGIILGTVSIILLNL